ncbi:C4-dicarboxylate TRAP transporter large permease protein DctM [subsurface metagenome]
MSPELVGLLGIVAVVVLLLLRFWIGAAFIVVGFLGYGYLVGWEKALLMAAFEPFSNIAQYHLTVIPMFILMGAVVANTGVSGDLYNTAHKWIGQLRGGLAMTTVVSCGMFAAVCGSSMATSVTMGKVAFPEMKKHNYDPRLASGSIAAGGTLGILIPPSMGFILYGIITETSIGKLFMAGIIPGVLEVVFYMITIYILCLINPLMGPPGPKAGFKEKIFSLRNTWAMITLFLIVMGGIYMGIFTPTEAGAVGAFGAIVISFFARRLTLSNFRATIIETAQTTGMIALILVGAFIFMRFLTVSRLPFLMGEMVSGLPVPPMAIMMAIIVFYILVGCIMDIVAALLITVPIIFPVVLALGFDPIWFGVIMVRMFEIGAITPPMGLNVFILATATDVPIGTIFRGIIPFLLADFAHVALLVAIPALSLFLPSIMM